ncbi:DUF3467 domain-containing protein [bacterium]|nr:DUF3467 domain-containing protein [bacterium]
MADNPQNPQEFRLNIELPDDKSEGIYANLAIIAFSPSEFIVDFVRAVPRSPKAKVQSRIIMTPHNVKLLQRALEENINKFESKYGEIKIMGKGEKSIGFASAD